MTRVVIDQDITPTDLLLDQLPDSWETTVGIPNERPALLDALSECDIALVTSRIPLSRDVLDRTERLSVIGKLGTGIDSIDIEAARENGITVTHTPGFNALSVAEHAVCLALATSRRLTAARSLVTDGRWRDEYTLGSRLSGSTVGLVGFGNVGKRVGTVLSGFDIELLVYDPYVHRMDSELAGGEMTSFDDLLGESDVVIVAAELTDETRGMIGERELSLMDPDAILVNVARGPIVQKKALLDALASHSIGGAGLDVFWEEPLDPDSELLDMDDVVVSPHIAAVTTEARTDNITQLSENVRQIVAGEAVHERYVATASDHR